MRNSQRYKLHYRNISYKLNKKDQIWDSFLCFQKRGDDNVKQTNFVETFLQCPFVHLRLRGSLCFSYTKMSERIKAIIIYSIQRTICFHSSNKNWNFYWDKQSQELYYFVLIISTWYLFINVLSKIII